MKKEFAFEMATSNIRYGAGSSSEVGMDLKDLGVKLAMVLTDPNLADGAAVETVLGSLKREGVACELYDQVRIEPTDASFKHAIAHAGKRPFEAFVAVGGGSVIDTAKAANLYSSQPPDDFLDYVNPPLGKGLPVPGSLKPLFALPTTAGTGSETTGVAVFDLESVHVKTGIASRKLKPTLGIIDPDNTRTMPPMVAAATGLDVLTHAVESYTAIPYTRRSCPERPGLRPNYQGSNPVSDIWSLKAMQIMAQHFVRSVEHPEDGEARGWMMLAASFAGVGFGNAGVTLPHAMSYPVSGMVKGYHPPDYNSDHAMVPHGMAVALNAPACFRFTAPSNPRRHLEAAAALGQGTIRARPEEAGEVLAQTMIGYMKHMGLPNGLGELGYGKADIPKLVEGTLAQQRLTRLSPKPAGKEELAALFTDAMSYW